MDTTTTTTTEDGKKSAGRPKKRATAAAAEICEDLISALQTVKTNLSNNATVQSEADVLINYARIILNKLVKVERLSESIGKDFVVINPETNEMRRVSFDEGYRQIMGYMNPKEGETIYVKLDQQYRIDFDEFIKWRNSKGH